EKLQERAQASIAGAAQAPGGAGQAASGGILGGLNDVLFGTTGPRGAKHDGLAQSMAKSAVRTMGSSVGREIIRGVLGSLFGGSKR
ncbi:MAG: helicase HerA-like domain-containing protein, partial [Polaromonas sp.]